jgi:hypothetical protein
VVLPDVVRGFEEAGLSRGRGVRRLRSGRRFAEDGLQYVELLIRFLKDMSELERGEFAKACGLTAGPANESASTTEDSLIQMLLDSGFQTVWRLTPPYLPDRTFYFCNP